MFHAPQSAVLQPIFRYNSFRLRVLRLSNPTVFSPLSSFTSVLGAQNMFLSSLVSHNSPFVSHSLLLFHFVQAATSTMMCIMQMLLDHCITNHPLT